MFDRERLEWLNGQWIRRLEADDLIDRLRPFLEPPSWPPGGSTGCPSDDEVRALLPVIQERLPTLGAIGDLVGFLWVDEVELDPAVLVPKRWDVATTREGLAAARATIAEVGEVSFEADELEPPLRALAEARGWKAGDLFMAIRVAVTGRTATPPLFDTLVALGRDRALARLDRARGGPRGRVMAVRYVTSLEGISTDDLAGGFWVGWPTPPTPPCTWPCCAAARPSSWPSTTTPAGTPGRVVGFVNAIGDGVLAAHLPLLEVLPAWQGQGIGSELVRRVLDALGPRYMVDLVCDDDVVPFYERLGLSRYGAMIRRDRGADPDSPVAAIPATLRVTTRPGGPTG